MRWKRLAIKILIYLTLILWVGGVLFCIGYRLRHPVNSYSNPQSQQQERERIGITQQGNASPRREQADNQETYAAKWFEPITLLTVFLVIGVAVTAYIYWRQLKEMQQTVALVAGQRDTMQGQLDVMQDTLEQNKRIVSASEAQASAAQASIENAKQTFFTGERAYMGIDRVELSELKAGLIPMVRIFLMNAGKTPAWNVTVRSMYSLDDYACTRAQLMSSTAITITHIIPAMLSRQLNMNIDNLAIPEAIAEVMAGTLKFFIRGEATFFDISNEQRTFSFCLRYNPKTGIFSDCKRDDYRPGDEQPS